MDDTQISPFGGMVGRVLRDSMSVGTAVTGIVLGLLLLGSGFVLGLAGAKGLSMILGQVIVAVALARFALNGMAGESSGTIFSTTGGSWPMAIAVAGRYLVLNLLWMVPLLILVWILVGSAASTMALPGGAAPLAASPDGPGGVVVPGSTAMTGGAGGLMLMLPILNVLTSKSFIAAAVLIMLGMAILPPIFLIVAVRSESFGQIFSTVLWSNTFSGRLGDLYAIYVVHGGALGMLFILAIPALLLTFAAGKEIGVLFLAIGLAYSGGLAIALLGRLCGFFAFGEESYGPALAMSAPTGPVHGMAGGRAGRPRPPEIFGAPETAVHPHVTAADVEAGPGHGAPHAPAAPASAPAIADLSQQVAAALARFESDADGALGELQSLREQNPDHPQVLHAIALSLHKAGRAPEAILAARQAIPVCLEHGHAALAAEIFVELWKQAKEMGLSREQIDLVATVLAKSGDHARAITAFGIALQMDAGDRKAIKGLLQLADHKMHREGRPKDAARIYTFLLQYASDSPFADDIRRGLADAESRLARAS